MMRKLLIILVMLYAGRLAAQGRIDIRAYGAVGDGKTVNTVAIQRAMDTASHGRGVVVLVPAGRWLTGVLTLRTGVELHLDSGAVLLGSTSRLDYVGRSMGRGAKWWRISIGC